MKGNEMNTAKQKTKAEPKVLEHNFLEGDIVTCDDDDIDKTEKFKIVEIIGENLHIKMLNEPYASYLVPITSVTKV